MELSEYINQGIEARKSVDLGEIAEISKILLDAIKGKGKLVTFGNGGSAADAQHFAAEFSGRFLKERRSLPAIALTTNTSSITAIGNDYSYDDVFSRQVKGLVNENDFVVGISTSGNSANVMKGLQAANTVGAYTVALTGMSGGQLKNVAKRTICVNSEMTPIIQEIHIAIIHMICLEIDRQLNF